MKRTMAVQLPGLRESELLQDQLAIRAAGYEPIFFGVIPMTTDLTGLESASDYDLIIPLGSTKLIRLWLAGHTPPNMVVSYDIRNFDQAYYGKLIRPWLLNIDAKYTTLGQIKNTTFPFEVFIKPTRDLKPFAGAVLEQGQTIGDHIKKCQTDSTLTDDEPVLIAPWQPIARETRNFVVGGKLITSSVYCINRRITHEPVSMEQRRVHEAFINKVANVYMPHVNYVIDLAEMEDGSLKIVEYNCINCAGQYAADRAKLFKAMVEEPRYHILAEKASVGQKILFACDTYEEAFERANSTYEAAQALNRAGMAGFATRISLLKDGRPVYRCGAI